MGFLRTWDYNSTIQSVYFQQLVQGSDSNRLREEATAQAEMISYLTAQYDVTTEFANTTVFKYPTVYKANALVELNFPAYDPLATYPMNSLVTYSGVEYYSLVPILIPEPFAVAKWQPIGNQYDLWFLAYPFPLFDAKGVYNIGDKVYWNGKIYQCLIATTILGRIEALQREDVTKYRVRNIFPDDPANGATYWGIGTPYSVGQVIPGSPAPSSWVAGFYPQGALVTYQNQVWQVINILGTNTVPGADILNWQPVLWTFGDNRNPQLVKYMCYLVVWYLSPTLAPQNVPKHWKERYDDTIEWLRMVAKGDVTAAIPEKTPPQGQRIRYGGEPKQRNTYS